MNKIKDQDKNSRPQSSIEDQTIQKSLQRRAGSVSTKLNQVGSIGAAADTSSNQYANLTSVLNEF